MGIINQLRTTLMQAFEHSRLPDRELLDHLKHLQEKLTKEPANTLSEAFDVLLLCSGFSLLCPRSWRYDKLFCDRSKSDRSKS
jgi:hypothetical protein